MELQDDKTRGMGSPPSGIPQRLGYSRPLCGDSSHGDVTVLHCRRWHAEREEDPGLSHGREGMG